MGKQSRRALRDLGQREGTRASLLPKFGVVLGHFQWIESGRCPRAAAARLPEVAAVPQPCRALLKLLYKFQTPASNLCSNISSPFLSALVSFLTHVIRLLSCHTSAEKLLQERFCLFTTLYRDSESFYLLVETTYRQVFLPKLFI